MRILCFLSFPAGLFENYLNVKFKDPNLEAVSLAHIPVVSVVGVCQQTKSRDSQILASTIGTLLSCSIEF